MHRVTDEIRTRIIRSHNPVHYQVCHSHSSGYGSRTHYLLVMSQLFKPFHSSASRSSRIRTDNLVNPNHAVYQIDIYSEMKWFCPSSSLCQHFYRGHFSRPGSRLLSALRTQFFFLRDSLTRFVDDLCKSLTISYLI